MSSLWHEGSLQRSSSSTDFILSRDPEQYSRSDKEIWRVMAIATKMIRDRSVLLYPIFSLVYLCNHVADESLTWW